MGGSYRHTCSGTWQFIKKPTNLKMLRNLGTGSCKVLIEDLTNMKRYVKVKSTRHGLEVNSHTLYISLSISFLSEIKIVTEIHSLGEI